MTTSTRARPLFDSPLVRQAMLDALRKLDPDLRNEHPFEVEADDLQPENSARKGGILMEARRPGLAPRVIIRPSRP